jgi:23S rRNA (guanosine2251-2'-O)-methyltransferase
MVRPEAPSAALERILAEARARHVLVEEVDPEALDAQSVTGRHQGVIAQVRLPDPLDLDSLLAKTQQAGAQPFFVVLDGVEDPQNLGAIARSAEAAGANGLILPERHSAHVSPGSLRASAGAIILLPVVIVKNTARCLEALKAQGVWVAGADPAGEKVYHQASLGGPLALVIGGESRGLHRLVRDRCDFLVKVPLYGRVESLNASAAAAVLLFEIARQRGAGDAGPKQHPANPK